MKKRIISFVLSLSVMISCSLFAFASPNFNLRTFHGKDDITVVSPNEEGTIAIYVDSMTREPSICAQTDDAMVAFKPMVVVGKTMDMYGMYIYRFSLQNEKSGDSGEIEFRIKDNIYCFYNMKNTVTWYEEGLNQEQLLFVIDRNSVEFMEALENNPDEEVRCTLSIGKNTESFAMNDTTRNGLLYLYKLFKLAGGTEQNNLDNIWINNNANSYKYRKIGG